MAAIDSLPIASQAKCAHLTGRSAGLRKAPGKRWCFLVATPKIQHRCVLSAFYRVQRLTR